MALSKVKKWQFPVVAKSTDNAEGINDLHTKLKLNYQSLLSATNGFYPVGLNKFVHMGIHIDKDALNELGIGEPIKTKVNCIANGEVIAYRVNGHYPKIDYDKKVAFFSTGFVLVRHLLEMERAAEENTETTENEPGNRLYFYSLYMHMADSAYYDKNPEETAPAFWDQDTYRVIDHKDLNYVEGLNIRKNPDSSNNDEILAVLQEGTMVNLNLAVHDENKQWYAVSSLAEGYSSIPVLTTEKYQHDETTVEILGWIFTGREVTETEFTILGSEEDKKLVAKNAANEMKSNHEKSKGLRVWNDFTNKNDKKLYSMLPIGTQIKISGTKESKKYVELIEVVRGGKPTLPLPTEKKKVWYDCLENITRGKKYDEVVVLDTPFPIKAGDLVGHIGNYHDYEAGIDKEKDKEGKLQDIETLPEDTLQRSYFKPLLHVECFTCEDLTNYITQTQTEAGRLVDTEQPFLAISKGAKLLATPNQGDTTVGKPYTDTKIIVKSKNVGIKWIQIEINTSETETQRLWIENSEEVAKTAKPDGEISLNEDTVAWSQHPLQLTELANSPQTADIPFLLYLNDEELTSRDKRAEDEQGALWLRVAALDEKNLPIVGWVSSEGEGVKKASAWDWFDFSQLTENASLVEFYKDVKLSEKRNNDNPSLDKYKPTLKTTLSVLDRQYPIDSPETQRYACITRECFRGIIEKPILFEALGRLLINYQSEWYSEVGTDGKMPEREALNSEMTDDAENALDYLKDGDEVKRDAYLKNIGKTADSKEATELKQRRERISRFPEDYKENPKEKLNQEQFKDYNYMYKLEVQVEMWEKEKEKIKKCLWWKDVVDGLANQNQPTAKDNAGNESGGDTETAQTDTSPPATLNQDGKAWFIHPISIINYFSAKYVLFKKGDKHNIIREINIRLAGFGGNVPTDEFTERTENMIKQFQRDYMEVEETGFVAMDVIKAIDEFQREYPIDTYFEQARCKCSNLTLAKNDIACEGFGRGLYADQRQKKETLEAHRKYEYPGLHRTLFWVLRAWKFYLTHFDKRNMKIASVSSGYRCWSDNHSHNRKTTNHMGKALDINLVHNDSKVTVANLCDNARDVMIRYCDAHYRWSTPNVISLEVGNRVKISTDTAIASIWVHFDVRSFELDYLKDEYFVQSVGQVNGLSMQTLIANMD